MRKRRRRGEEEEEKWLEITFDKQLNVNLATKGN